MLVMEDFLPVIPDVCIFLSFLFKIMGFYCIFNKGKQEFEKTTWVAGKQQYQETALRQKL